MKVTKKVAIALAVEALRGREQNKTTLAAIETLEKLAEEVARPKWTKESIIETFNEWAEERGAPPTVNDLGTEGMPSVFVVRRVFGERPSNVLYSCFPNSYRSGRVYCDVKFKRMTREQLIEFFAAQFAKIMPPTSSYYNKHRAVGTPTWETGARALGCTSWKEFYRLVTNEDPPLCRPGETCTVVNVVVNSHLVDTLADIVAGEEKED